jgi:hypothetical protein
VTIPSGEIQQLPWNAVETAIQRPWKKVAHDYIDLYSEIVGSGVAS